MFTLTYDRARGEELEVDYPARIGVQTIRSSKQSGPECPLLGPSAAAAAAGVFGYSPAWYAAVDEVFGAPSERRLLDPLPLECELSMSGLDACGATLVCAEHEYHAAFDAEGQLRCARDKSPIEPATPQGQMALDACFIFTLPADACFGPGWSQHFQLGAELR